MSIKCVIYLRVSTKSQDTDNQLQPLKEYVERMGYELVGVYEDFGVSGVKSSRPQLDQMILDGRRRKFSMILSWSIDRIGRNMVGLCGFGDSNKANARYIKLRFEQIKSEIRSSSRASSVSSLPKESIKVKLTIFDFWDNFNTVGKLALIGILLLVGYGILGGNMDPYFQPSTSSKDNGAYSQPSTSPSSSTIVNTKSVNCIFIWNEPQRTFVKVDDDIFDSVKYTNTIIVKIGKEAYSESLFVQLRKADADKNESLAKSIAKEIRANALTVYFEKNLSADFINLIANEQNLRSRCL